MTPRRSFWLFLLSGALITFGMAGTIVAAQDSLSTQVLRLLTRVNLWTAKNTYSGGIGLVTGAPAVTTDTLYQVGDVLYWHGSAIQTAQVGAGTVTSVALTAPGIFSVAGSPVTSSGTLALSLASQTANLVWAGPTSGSAAAPTFRGVVDADIPNTITIDGSGNVTWASVSKSGSSLADLATRSASDLGSGTLPDARFPATLPALSGVNLTALSASNLGSGTVPAARMPALTGDITTSAGAVATTLAVSGVTAGSYGGSGNLLSITVDAKGRITSLADVAAGTHALLSATHTDTLAGTVVRGDVIVGNSTPKWSRLARGTAGQVLVSDGTDVAWGTGGSALTALNASNLSSGTAAVARGGTGTGSTPTNGQLLIGNATDYTLATLTGTANQITVTNGAGSITLATPQAIATSSTPQFARLGLGGAADSGSLLLFTGGDLAHVEVDDGNTGTADTIDWRTGNIHKSTLTGNVVYTWTAPRAGTWLDLWLVQDGTGSRTATFPTIRWAGGSPPTLTTAAGKVDWIRCYYNGTSYFCDKVLNY